MEFSLGLELSQETYRITLILGSRDLLGEFALCIYTHGLISHHASGETTYIALQIIRMLKPIRLYKLSSKGRSSVQSSKLI